MHEFVTAAVILCVCVQCTHIRLNVRFGCSIADAIVPVFFDDIDACLFYKVILSSLQQQKKRKMHVMWTNKYTRHICIGFDLALSYSDTNFKNETWNSFSSVVVVVLPDNLTVSITLNCDKQLWTYTTTKKNWFLGSFLNLLLFVQNILRIECYGCEWNHLCTHKYELLCVWETEGEKV